MSDRGGWSQPSPMQPSGPYGPILTSIGDIAVTATHVLTPSGAFPLEGTTWLVQENVQATEGIPTWAIVLAVIFVFLCLLGLLFLLVKERKVTGWVQVSVQGPGLFHATQIPAHSAMQVGAIHQQVNYVRQLVASR